MKTLVTFYSVTGNTKKVAEAVYDGLTGTDNEMVSLDDANSLDAFDVIFVGFPVQGSRVPEKAEKFLQGIPENKMVAIFATHSCLRGGQLAIEAFYHAITLASGSKIIGTFGCRGEVKPGIIEAMMEKPEHRGWALEARSAVGHPDDADLQDARTFAESMIAKSMQL